MPEGSIKGCFGLGFPVPLFVPQIDVGISSKSGPGTTKKSTEIP